MCLINKALIVSITLKIGNGLESTNLESLTKRLDVDAEFAGEIPSDVIPDYFRRRDILGPPFGRGEGLPSAVLESIAVGLPVVVTDTVGVADAVIDGETGYVIELDHEAALADRINRLCRDDDQR